MKTLHATYCVYVWNIIALHFPYFAESDENVGTFEIHPYGKKKTNVYEKIVHRKYLLKIDHNSPCN
jgi:hypothetical protein